MCYVPIKNSGTLIVFPSVQDSHVFHKNVLKTYRQNFLGLTKKYYNFFSFRGGVLVHILRYWNLLSHENEGKTNRDLILAAADELNRIYFCNTGSTSVTIWGSSTCAAHQMVAASVGIGDLVTTFTLHLSAHSHNFLAQLVHTLDKYIKCI